MADRWTRHLICILLAFPSLHLSAGDLAPPRAPGPTQSIIEPRTPISDLPFVIERSGSYYVTAHLEGTEGHGINVNADNVTIDLNGFTLAGGPCTEDGIHNPHLRNHFIVRNGIIADWGGNGILANLSTCTIEGIQVIRSGGRGIDMSLGVIRDCTVRSSGSDGIRVGARGVVRSCFVGDSGETGFDLGQGSVATDCISIGDAIGFAGSRGTQLEGCVAKWSREVGFRLSQQDCGMTRCTVAEAWDVGVHVDGGCSVTECRVSGWWSASPRPRYGIRADGECRIVDCSVELFERHIVAVGGAVIDGCQVTRFAGNQIGEDPELGISVGLDSTVTNCTVQTRGIGIAVTDRCTVRGNDCNRNFTDTGAGVGIQASGEANVISGNRLRENDTGIVVNGARNLVFGNMSTGDTVPFQIVNPAANSVAIRVSAEQDFSIADPRANILF